MDSLLFDCTYAVLNLDQGDPHHLSTAVRMTPLAPGLKERLWRAAGVVLPPVPTLLVAAPHRDLMSVVGLVLAGTTACEISYERPVGLFTKANQSLP